MNKSQKFVKVLATATISSMLLSAGLPVMAYTKDETVYSKNAGDGSVYQTVVSEHLKNTDNLEEILDQSILSEIKNTNGDEEFNQDGNTLVWKSNGSDIYYQGNTEKELPISMSISYKLDGEDINAADLAGKSGKLEINIDYENHEAHTEYVNGKYVTMYTPFVVVSGLLLNKDNSSNVTVNNGEVVDNGNSIAVVGISMPGLAESLDVSEDKLDVPENLKITADVTDFEMSNIMTYASPKLLKDVDLDSLDEIDDAISDVNKLSDASKELVDGADQLANGAIQVNDGALQVLSGVQLMNVSVNKSINSMRNNKLEALKAKQIESIGTTAGSTAKSTVSSKEYIAKINKTASAGVDDKKEDIGNEMVATAKTIAEKTALATAKQVAQNTAVSTLKQSAVQIAYESAVTAAQKSAWTTANMVYDKTVTDDGIKAKVIYELREKDPKMAKLTNAEIEATDDYKTQYATAKNTAETTAKGQLDETKIKEQAKSIVDKEFGVKDGVADPTSTMGKAVLAKVLSDKQVETIKSTALKGVEAQESIIKKTADAGIEAQESTIKAGAVTSAKQIATTTAEATAKTVAEQVGNQVGKTVAKDVANQVKTGVLNNVASSMSELTNGLDQLEIGTKSLTYGTNSLAEGAKTLSDGMNKFDNEGIQKLAKLANGDVKDLKVRIQKLQKLSKDYVAFAGNSEDAKDVTTKFVIITDEIKK